jgi:3-methyl-2-oxobutanoate hydroxymethyltransferase
LARKQTIATIRQKKARGEKITALTAYDFPTARVLDQAGLDIILVGDSLGMVVQGGPDTLAVTAEEMLYHLRLVRRAVQSALLVVDMPYGSFHVSPRRTVRNAIILVKEGGAEAVKVEGGRQRLAAIRALLDAEIPVLGHLGLTPQSIHRFGGYKIQGRSLGEIEVLLSDAEALEAEGCFGVVLEGIPHPVAGLLTSRLGIPTIGIGSGPRCDGQILVSHDMLGWNPDSRLTFVREYAGLAELISGAVKRYAADVRQGAFPSLAESFPLDPEVEETLEKKYGTHRQD